MPTGLDFQKLKQSTKRCYPNALVQSKTELTLVDVQKFSEVIAEKSSGSLSEKEVADYLKDTYSYASDAVKLAKIKKLLSEFGIQGKFKVIHSNGSEYVVFKGYPGKRNLFKGTRYSATNPSIVDMAITKTGIVKDAVKGSLLTFVVYAPLNVVKTLMQDKPTIGYLLGNMASDVIKIGTSAAFTAGTTAILAAATGLVILPIAAGLVVGIVVGMALNELDNRYKLTERMITYFEDNIDRPLARFLYEMERHIIWQYTNQMPF